MRTSIIITTLLFFFQVYAQKCVHSNLSKEYDFKTSLIRETKNNELSNECEVVINIINKTTKTGQIIKFHSDWMLNGDYKDCKTVRSYTTKFNHKAVAQDNDFGDLIIADFNFDEKDDIAIKAESGGNGGPLYKFYLQENNKNFVEDKYLSNIVTFFPVDINAKSKTLKTKVYANAYEQQETIYKANKINGNWKIISQRLIK